MQIKHLVYYLAHSKCSINGTHYYNEIKILKNIS